MRPSLLFLVPVMVFAASADAQPYEVHPTPAETVPPELRLEPVVAPAEPAPVKMPETIVISPALPPYEPAGVVVPAPAARAWPEVTFHFGAGGVTPNLDKVAAVTATDTMSGGFASLEVGRPLASAEQWMPAQVRAGVALTGLHANEYSLGSEVTVDTLRFSVRSQVLWPLAGPLQATLAGVLGASRGEASLNLDGADLTQSKVWGAHAELLGGLEAKWAFESFIGGFWWETGPVLESALDFDALAQKGAPSVDLGAFDASGWRNAGGLFVGFAE